MVIQLLRAVKHDGTEYAPGRKLDDKTISDKDARTLIRKGAAIDISADAVEELDDDDVTLATAQLIEIDGVNEDLAGKLINAGYASVEAVANANPDDLQKIKGIGKKNVTDIMESAESLLEPEGE